MYRMHHPILQPTVSADQLAPKNIPLTSPLMCSGSTPLGVFQGMPLLCGRHADHDGNHWAPLRNDGTTATIGAEWDDDRDTDGRPA